jgi:hypothetical protein
VPERHFGVQASTFQVLAKTEFGRFSMSQGLEEVYGNVGGDVVPKICRQAIPP